MQRLTTILLIIQLLTTALQADGYKHSKQSFKKASKAVNKLWSEKEPTLEPFTLNFISGNFSPNDTIFRIEGHGSILGYVIVTAAKGRFDYFDFMVVYSSKPQLLSIQVLVYRSEYGSQISSKAWLKQFYGSPMDQVLQYGADVDALSGATISAKSVTGSVNRLNSLMLEILK